MTKSKDKKLGKIFEDSNGLFFNKERPLSNCGKRSTNQ